MKYLEDSFVDVILGEGLLLNLHILHLEVTFFCEIINSKVEFI